MFSRRTLSRAFFAAIIGAAVIPLGAGKLAAADVEWKAYTYSPATAVAYQKMEEMVNAFEEQTSGRIEITLNAGGSLPIKGTNITQAIGDGILDLAGDAFYAGNVSFGNILFLPGLVQTSEELDTAFDIIEPALEEEMSKLGVEVLGYYHYPLQVLWSISELKSWQDLDGKKVRVTSPAQGEFVQNFGGIPVTLSSSEVAPALQRGIIDVVITAASAGAKRYQDSLKHGFLIGPNLHTSFILANKASFDALGAEDQQLLQELATKAGQEITAQLAVDEVEMTKMFEEEGITTTAAKPSDSEELVEAMSSYWDSWAESEGEKAVTAVNEIRKTLGR
ncbi:MAG: TRAP transporter substrate-binding protein DctP [Rhodovibrionaceae bacterium]